MVAAEHRVWLGFFFVLPCIAVPGNVLLFAFSLRRGRDSNASDALMAALSVMDMIKIGLIAVIAFEAYYHINWTLNEFSCQLVMKSLFVFYFMTLFVIMFLTRIRHIGIQACTFGTSSCYSLRFAAAVCLALFVLTVTIASIPGLYAWTINIYGATRVCELAFEVPRWLWICCQVGALVVTLAPAIYLVFVCYRVRHTLQLTLHNLQATSDMSKAVVTRRQHRNRRVVLVLAVIALGFTICWIPVHILHTMELFRTRHPTEQQRLDELLAFHTCFFLWFVGLESCVSTIAFSCFSQPFRTYVRALCRRKRPRTSVTSLSTGVSLGDVASIGTGNEACFYDDEK